MKIVIEPGSYSLLNVGDVAMLQMTTSRVKEFFPDARLHIVTESPDRLASLFPGALPITTASRAAWYRTNALPQRLMSGFGDVEKRQAWERKLRRSWPAARHLLLRTRYLLRRHECTACEYFNQIRTADLFIISGQGTFNDLMQAASFRLLEFLSLGQKRGIPTLMFGQGIGPIEAPDLLEEMQAVLPNVKFITLREKRLGLPLLRTLGVDDARIATPGDDTIELAYTHRNKEIGFGLGVNLRVASYTGIKSEQLQSIRSILHQAARKHAAPLIPLPISHNPHSHDPTAIKTLLEGFDDTTDGGESLETVENTLQQVSHCRVVITGSYHGGVFALSQGIPVVAIASTPYYQGKFLGLLDQFGMGCEVVLAKDVTRHLEKAIDDLWKISAHIRTDLLKAAQRQIEEGQCAYRKAFAAAME